MGDSGLSVFKVELNVDHNLKYVIPHIIHFDSENLKISGGRIVTKQLMQ